jgi:hypothetical protein
MISAVDQRRDRHHRIDRAIARFPLLALDQIDLNDLVRHEPLEVERDPHAVGRK